MFPLSARLSLAIATLLPALIAAAPAAAQSGYDPADTTRGRYDPAAVGAPRAGQPAAQPFRYREPSPEEKERIIERMGLRQPGGPLYGQQASDETARTLQSLLYTAREMGGSRYNVDGRQQDVIDGLRRDMERVASQVWDQLSPLSQQRYREALDQTKRLDGLANTNYRDIDAFRARGGAAGMARETEATIRSLDDALTLMLQDVRAKLQQQSRRPVR